jgi:hypothetical protein
MGGFREGRRRALKRRAASLEAMRDLPVPGWPRRRVRCAFREEGGGIFEF